MAKILITGGSGLVGSAISELLIKNKHEPVWLSRNQNLTGLIKSYKWDLSQAFIDEHAFENVQHIIHLAGSNIANKRWSQKYKQTILDSRVKSSELLYNYLSKKNYGIQTLVGGSAIGYYGSRQSENIITENDQPGSDFLGHTCDRWEKSYLPYSKLGIRTVVIRTGVVLSNRGGAYQTMAPIFRSAFGSALGSGDQYFPWIHIRDLASIFEYALFNKNLEGIYNGVASELITNQAFSKALANSFHKKVFLPNIPAFVLRLAMGKGAVMVTEGLKISNAKIKTAGFKFEFENVQSALKDLAINKAT